MASTVAPIARWLDVPFAVTITARTQTNAPETATSQRTVGTGAGCTVRRWSGIASATEPCSQGSKVRARHQSGYVPGRPRAVIRRPSGGKRRAHLRLVLLGEHDVVG